MRHLIETSRMSVPAPAPSTGPFINKESLSLIKIEVLVCLTAFLLIFLVTFGSWRRRCNNGIFRLIMFVASISPIYILTYALGLMYQSPVNAFFPIWAMFLMVVLGSADSFSAYRLEDNEQWKTYNWQSGIKFVWLALLLSSYPPKSAPTRIALCLIVVLILKSHEKALALATASRHSLERSMKVIADYTREKPKERGAVDAGAFCFKNCYYLVRGDEEKWENILVIRLFKWWQKKMALPELAPNYRTPLEITDEVITLEKVWNCPGRLLSSDANNKLKDYCLSFAFCKLLRLKFAGYSLPQEIHQNTRTLIKNELLNDYRRAFRVIEIELSYLFDFFYTKYWVIFYPGRLYVKLVEVVYFSMGIWAATAILIDYKATTEPGDTDTLVSTVMILAFIAVELVQLFLTCFSEWNKLVCICKYVEKKSWQKKEWIERMVKFVCRVQIVRPWERKLRQYSFLESYSYRPCALIYNRISASYIGQRRKGQRQSRPIKLSEDVTKAVFNKLKLNCEAEVENGQVLLRLNHVPEKLSWACKFETQTQVILVWHIATSFYEQQPEQREFLSNSSETETTRNFRIATKLSNYLAYLVAFAPQLLPDHRYIAKYVFDQAILEARIFFEECKNMKDRIAKMKKQDSHPALRERTITWQGARLGNQLVDEIKDVNEVWKILAEFWVETMLYVAPSDNANAHAEHLTRGGEFVTHLWALVSHAGIERAMSRVSQRVSQNHKRSKSSPS